SRNATVCSFSKAIAAASVPLMILQKGQSSRTSAIAYLQTLLRRPRGPAPRPGRSGALKRALLRCPTAIDEYVDGLGETHGGLPQQSRELVRAQPGVERARRDLLELGRRDGVDEPGVQAQRASEADGELAARDPVAADDVHDAAHVLLSQDHSREGQEV